MPTSDWLTWQEAASLVGCPVSTIDWWKRQGRIVSRGRRGRSLERTSVEEFAIWWAQRRTVQAVRSAERKAAASERQPPEGDGWMTTREAAALVKVVPSEIVYLIKTRHLQGVRTGGRWWVREEHVNSYVKEEARWITQREAAALIGISSTAVGALAATGSVTKRVAAKRRPSIERRSADAYATVHRAAVAERARSALAVEPSRSSGPPQDGKVWLDATTTGVLLGVSNVRVLQLIRADRIPATRVGRRWWIQRNHAEQIAAARVRVRQEQQR